MQGIYNFLTKIGITRGQDKVLHFCAGFVIAIGLSFVLPDITLFKVVLPGPILAFIFTLIVGAGKEAYDSMGYGDASFFDFFATAMGAVAGVFGYGIIMAFMG